MSEEQPSRSFIGPPNTFFVTFSHFYGCIHAEKVHDERAARGCKSHKPARDDLVLVIFRERKSRRFSATFKGKAPRSIPSPTSHPRTTAGSSAGQSDPPQRWGLPAANPARGGRDILGVQVQLQLWWWLGTGWTPQSPQGWLRGAELHLTNPRLTEGWARDVASGQATASTLVQGFGQLLLSDGNWAKRAGTHG